MLVCRESLTISRDLFYSPVEFIVRGDFRSRHGIKHLLVRSLDTCNVSAHRGMCAHRGPRLFMVQIAARRLRCYSPLTRIAGRYFTPVCQRAGQGPRVLVACQDDGAVIVNVRSPIFRFPFDLHRPTDRRELCVSLNAFSDQRITLSTARISYGLFLLLTLNLPDGRKLHIHGFFLLQRCRRWQMFLGDLLKKLI